MPYKETSSSASIIIEIIWSYRRVIVPLNRACSVEVYVCYDEYIKKISDSKNKIIKSFEKLIKEAAVDCRLNINANNDNNNKEDTLVCD